MLIKDILIKNGQIVRKTKDDLIGGEALKQKVIQFIKSNPNPDDDQVHASSELKHGDDPDDMYDAQQLAMGIEVEKEHTDDPEMAKAIAKAHLYEIHNYYTRLAKIESEAKQ